MWKKTSSKTVDFSTLKCFNECTERRKPLIELLENRKVKMIMELNRSKIIK